MTVQEAISARHSVRTYLTKPVEPAIVNALRAEIRACNAEGGLHIQLVMNEPMAFRGFFAHYGKFRGVCNYIVLAGKRAKDLDERAGWFGSGRLDNNLTVEFKADSALMGSYAMVRLTGARATVLLGELSE